MGPGRLGVGVVVVLMGRELLTSCKLFDMSSERESRPLVFLLEADIITEATKCHRENSSSPKYPTFARQS